MNNNLRWESYVFMKGVAKIQSFWREHVKTKERNVLFILGKGFDIRMNEGIKHLIGQGNNVTIQCLLITYDEGLDSSSKDYQLYADQNFQELQGLSHITIESKNIELWKGKGRNKRRIGDKEAADLFSSYSDLQDFTDIIVDISALPRGIYFSLIGKLLTLIDINKTSDCLKIFKKSS